MYCGVHQLSRGTRAWLRVPRVSNICPSIWARFPGPMGSTRCPWKLAFHSEGPRGRPAVPGDSGQGPSARGQPVVPGDSDPGKTYRVVEQASGATRARVRWSGGSTSFPRPLGRVSEVPRVRPALPGESRSALRAKGLTHGPGRHGPEPYGLRDRPAAPGDSSSCAGGLGAGSEGPRGR